MTQKRLRIGILFGGPSSECEISLESGRHIYNNLDERSCERVPIFVDLERRFWEIDEVLLWMNTTADITEALVESEAVRIPYEALPDRIDFAFLGLHGKYGEDGCLQGLLEILNVPYNGSGILGSAIGMDKHFQRKLLVGAGLRVPQHLGIMIDAWQKDREALERRIASEIGFPCIVKPSREGCSLALAKVGTQETLNQAMTAAFEWDNLILIEEFIDAMEVTCTVLGNDRPEALIPTETPKHGDFLTVEEKFLPGNAPMITPPRASATEIERMRALFVRAYQALNLSVYARIDAFWRDGELIILEPNTLPGVTPSTMVFHQAAEAGITPREFFDQVIELSLEAYHDKIGPL
ncbi:MAG: D-alanine--D-alanine ligase [Candidatus Bipolaricaulia bacterium]